MKVFLCGGGAGVQNIEANKKLNEVIDHSKHRKVAALPEEVTLFVYDEGIEVIGNSPYYFFENGVIIKKTKNNPV